MVKFLLHGNAEYIFLTLILQTSFKIARKSQEKKHVSVQNRTNTLLTEIVLLDSVRCFLIESVSWRERLFIQLYFGAHSSETSNKHFTLDSSSILIIGF